MFQRMKAINHLTQPPRKDVNFLESSSEEKIFSGGGQWPNTGSQREPSDQWVTCTVPTMPIFKQEDPSVSYTK